MLTVITGSMFSGKTTELIRRIRCAEIARQRTLVLKPSIDTRSGLEVVSHSGLRWAASVISPGGTGEGARGSSAEGGGPRDRSTGVTSPFRLPSEFDVLGIDEAQFLHEPWLDWIDGLANAGKEVICACLNQDYRGQPFGISHRLLALADNVIHLKAVCLACGAKDSATKTHRVSSGTEQVEIGGADKYQALCRRCWVERQRERAYAAEAAVA
jgi:thymidine kinase